MNNDDPSHNNAHGRQFPHSFNIGTTLQNVFRNINHAFAHSHESRAQRDTARDPMEDMPPLEPLNAVAGAQDARPTETTHAPSRPAAPDPPISPAPVSAGTDAPRPPPSHPQRDDEEDSMPELRSVSDSSDESDAGDAFVNAAPHQAHQPVEDDQDSAWTDEEALPPVAPAIGTRRARVDDDGDDARDRRHPSERVGAPPPGDAAPQNAHPQPPPRPPMGLFGALFGLGPTRPGDAPPEHTHAHTGEDTADPSAAENNPGPGHAPRGAPILTAGFTLTIPLFGSPPGNRTGPAAGGQGGAPGMMGMDAATREELFASFAAFFQEFQATEEGREDPERAKKLVAGLDVVPLGLVKRLERVGGAPGGHAGDPNAEGASSGCAICWDTLLDTESDSFSGQYPTTDVPQPETQDETHTDGDAMDVDASASHPEPETSTSTPPSLDAAKIISLPCAHVFHASCLLPWFTRAKQATCPTCRFNIDPENLTYTPLPRRAFNRAPPAQAGDAAPQAGQANPQATPHVPPEAGVPAADAAAPQADPARETTEARPPTAAAGPAPPPPTGQAGVPPIGPGGHPFFNMPGFPVLSIPSIQIPLRPPAGQAPGDGNENQGMLFSPAPLCSRMVFLPSSTDGSLLLPGIDVVTIGLDMFVGVPPPEERGDDHRDNAEGADGADNGGAGTGPAGGNGGANPNGLAQDLHSLIEGILRTTRNIIPQVINPQGPVPPPAPDAPPAEGAQPQPQTRPAAPEAGEREPGPPPTGGPRAVPIFPLRPNMFRPTRPMPPRRERKTWTLPPAPGPSLRQRVEQREREQGLRCSDTSCGIGPSDDDPYPEPSASVIKQVDIYPLPSLDDPEYHGRASVCAHAFHPECLVSAERVAGWGGEDGTEPFVEVSCPVCRAVGCVTRDEWESGVSAL